MPYDFALVNGVCKIIKCNKNMFVLREETLHLL